VAKKVLEKIDRKEKCKLGHDLVYLPSQKRVRCYECDRARSRKYYNANKHKIKVKARSRQLRYLYGMTLKEFDNLLAMQNSKCAICGKEHSKVGLVVDHNHITGEIRGLLCRHCNFVLGLVNDDKDILKNAMEYLTNKP